MARLKLKRIMPNPFNNIEMLIVELVVHGGSKNKSISLPGKPKYKWNVSHDPGGTKLTRPPYVDAVLCSRHKTWSACLSNCSLTCARLNFAHSPEQPGNELKLTIPTVAVAASNFNLYGSSCSELSTAYLFMM
jgi:hypothetical protein